MTDDNRTSAIIRSVCEKFLEELERDMEHCNAALKPCELIIIEYAKKKLNQISDEDLQTLFEQKDS